MVGELEDVFVKGGGCDFAFVELSQNVLSKW